MLSIYCRCAFTINPEVGLSKQVSIAKFRSIQLHFFKAMDPNEWTLSNADLLQSVATLSWINDQHNSDMLQKVLAARVGYELYNRLSGQREVDVLQNQTIAAIAKYVKDNPRAKKEDMQKEIAKHIFAFAAAVDKL